MANERIRTFDQPPRDSFARPTILIVDDDTIWRKLARDVCLNALADLEVTVLDCESIEKALEILARQVVHAVVLDKQLSPNSAVLQQDGVASIPRFLEVQEHLQIVMATSSTEFQDIVDALFNGACSYVVKQSKVEMFSAVVRRALRTGLLCFHTKTEADQNRGTPKIELPGTSTAVQLLRARIHEMAKADAPVLFLGETGTGKTTAAKLLHELRNQYLKKQRRPFVHLNMAAIPESLAESELFGAEPDALTDAKTLKIGAIEQADGGTLFLDEVGEASESLQAKLLTVLDSGKFRRVGGKKELQAKFRLVCATNRNLERLIREKKFRVDLYRRISIIEIKLPSLHERKEDMPWIVESVLAKCCRQVGVYVDFEDIPKDFISSLADHPPIGHIGGVEQQLCRLLLFAPRDRKDRPILKQWKFIEGMGTRPSEIIKEPNRAMTMDEIVAKPLDVVGQPGFSGVREFLEVIEKKLYEDARRKLGEEYGSNRQIARALKVSDTAVGARLQHFGILRTSKRKEPGLKVKKGETGDEQQQFSA